jgi:hypothetical protein
MSVVDDIAAYLVASSTVFTKFASTGGNLAKQIMLDHQHAASTITVLYETAGSPNEYTFSTSTGKARVAFEKPGVQLLSRSTSYKTARSRAQTAYTLLDGVAGKNLPTATGTRYLEITAVQAPFFVSRDSNDRYIVSVNFETWKQVG